MACRKRGWQSNAKRKRIRKHILSQSGRTVDGKIVVKGIGKFTDCIGIPLIFILDQLKIHNAVMDWIDYIDYSVEKNWNPSNTLSKIEDALIDDENKNLILERLRYYILTITFKK